VQRGEVGQTGRADAFAGLFRVDSAGQRASAGAEDGFGAVERADQEDRVVLVVGVGRGRRGLSQIAFATVLATRNKFRPEAGTTHNGFSAIK
jgi:hypothetical protein